MFVILRGSGGDLLLPPPWKVAGPALPWFRAAPSLSCLNSYTPACSSRIVRGLAAPLWIITGLSLAVCGYESLQEAGTLPEAFQSISVANTEPFNLSSFALSLLLVRVLCCRNRCSISALEHTGST